MARKKMVVVQFLTGTVIANGGVEQNLPMNQDKN
jgi:hypothetical protein